MRRDQHVTIEQEQVKLMDQNDDTELPIAERTFFLDESPILVFRIWKPKQAEGEYPACGFEFRQGSVILKKGDVGSVDSIDCLLLCLAQAGTWIAGMNEAVFAGKLRWEGSPGGGAGHGLPTIESFIAMIPTS